MTKFITPDYVYKKIQRGSDETSIEYRDRLSRISLDETEDSIVRNAANKALWNLMSYE